MMGHQIEQDAEGNYSYRGWLLSGGKCGSPECCQHKSDAWLATSPYELDEQSMTRIWTSAGGVVNSWNPDAPIDAHKKGARSNFTIESKIDRFEHGLARLRESNRRELEAIL
ncbi:MAG: hypothetical protein Q8R78_01320 [Candidatus Omnitrophota bacterium]|nr:hypothetical protein [Candidatus Omnitrophota bacterium]